MNYFFLNKKRTYAFNSKTQFLDFIKQKKTILIALNAEKLNNTNKQLEEIINNNIGYPDGVGAVFALRKNGLKSIKIPGVEFWLDIIERFQKEKTFYFVGASQEVIDKTINKLQVQFPKINIKGYRNGFLNEGDKKKLEEELVLLKPDIVFIAQGSPRQEFLMHDLKQKHEALYMGLGGSFDVYSGLKKRAPKLFVNLGLEWFYRLLKEPKRLKRQVSLLFFLVKITLKKN